MARVVYKHVNLTIDEGNLDRCRVLARNSGHSVSAMVRFLISQAYDEQIEKIILGKQLADKRPHGLKIG